MRLRSWPGFSVGLAFATAFIMPSFAAEEAIPPAQSIVKVFWVDIRGKVLKISWPVRADWVWETMTTEPRVPRAFLEVTVDIPAEYVLQKVEGVGLKIEKKSNQFTVRTAQASANLNVRIASKKGGFTQLGVMIQLRAEVPKAVLHSKCAEAGIDIQEMKTKGGNYLSVYCQKAVRGIEAIILYPEGGKVEVDEEADGERFQKQKEGKNWVQLRMMEPRAATKNLILGRFGFISDRGEKQNFYVISGSRGDSGGPSGSSLPMQLSAGLGGTYMSYSEDPPGIRLTESAVTAKLMMNYELTPNQFDLGLSVFGNLLIPSRSPASLSAARFFGFNGRVGYQIPGKGLGLSWKVSAGWYYWSMQVTDDSYGISLLSGPQILINMSGATSGNRAYFAYIKYAPIFDQYGSLSMVNREAALGLGFQVNSSTARKRWFVTLDGSDAQYALTHTIQLDTVSLGIQTSL